MTHVAAPDEARTSPVADAVRAAIDETELQVVAERLFGDEGGEATALHIQYGARRSRLMAFRRGRLDRLGRSGPRVRGCHLPQPHVQSPKSKIDPILPMTKAIVAAIGLE